ncbi:hypothetical protein M9Y10_017921 [Tritrichomonas musculus]|uniref:HECT domain-containing protein n=1 Tax=Tritrichomonas musculus TaxID=1915356 RepID=A0ABR2HWL4_9EUKA
MGSNGSQPTQTPSSSISRRQPSRHSSAEHPSEYSLENPNSLTIYLNEQYEELAFHVDDVLQKQAKCISPPDLFYISVCYPYYCQSVHDMIRRAIRTESIQEAREQEDYLENFQFSEVMDSNRVKVFERCQFKQKIRTLFKDASSPAIEYQEERNNNEEGERENPRKQEEVTFGRILTMLRNRWSQKNRQTIINLFSNINELSDSPSDNFRKMETIFPILSQVMGAESCEAFVPHRDLIWNDIDIEFNDLKKILLFSKPRCCLNFTPSEPLHSLDVEGKVATHGICSNGKFLFVLTEEKVLNIYLIYKGMIHRKVARFQLADRWAINDETYLFCSQKWLFLKDKKITYQTLISTLTCDNLLRFTASLRPELQRVERACCNGATYSTFGREKHFQTFDADTDYLIMANDNRELQSEIMSFPEDKPYVTNGLFWGILLEDEFRIVSTYMPTGVTKYVKNEHFPHDNKLPVIAVTIDMLCNVYFSVTYDGTNSQICSHTYTGAPDAYLFGLKLTESINNNTFESCMLKHFLTCAFSPTIPENLIVVSNQIETDLKSITKWIQKYQNDVNLVKSLLLLLDLNFKKYETKEIAHSLLPLLKSFLRMKEYKRLVSAMIINNFDLFFDKFDLDEFAILYQVFDHPPKINGNIFNEWALNKLSQSSLLSKIPFDKEFILGLLTDRWYSIQRDQEPYAWMVNLLLVAQQTSIEEAVEIIEKDPMNLNKAKLIDSLCNYAQLLISQLLDVINQVIAEKTEKADRTLKYDSILYTLISNFFASAAPITECIQFASVITSDDSNKIIKLLNDEFEIDETLKLFIGYFDMIYTTSISTLIRGGSVYPCEEDYKWLIHCNFHNGDRNLTPSDLSQAKFFLASLENDIITQVSDNVNYLNKHVPKFKAHSSVSFIVPFIMAAFTRQTNTVHLLSARNENNKIPKELEEICNWTNKMRDRFMNIRQRDNTNILNNENNSNYQKQSDKILANLGILINLDPALPDYLSKSPSEREEYQQIIRKFILNNDPDQFHRVLKAIPTRITNVLNGIDKLNSLFNTIKNQIFHRIIIDGISRVNPFERLGYLLSHSELDNDALSILTKFHESCISILHKFHQISILEILYTVLTSCNNFKGKAIEVMNELSYKIRHDDYLSDPYFMTVAGLAASTSTIPELLSSFPQKAKACIIQLLFSKKDAPSILIDEVFSYILNKEISKEIYNPIWIKMLFSVFNKCENNELNSLNKLFQSIFHLFAKRLNDERIVFSSLPEIVYGFRTILNSNNNLSTGFQEILHNIRPNSSFGEIFLLFAIIGGDISEYSTFYSIRNRHGKWLKYSKDNEEYCLQIPITPLTERQTFDINEIVDHVIDVELNMEKSLSFNDILSFWDICMKDQGSVLCRVYLQTLARCIQTMEENIPVQYLSQLAKSAKPYIDFHILLSNQTKLYKSLSKSFKSTKNLLPEHENGFGVIKQDDWVHLFAYNIMKIGQLNINAIILGEGFIVIHRQKPIVIQVPSGAYNGSQEKLFIENGAFSISVIDGKIISICDRGFEADPNTYIEFIAKSIEDIIFEMEHNFDFSNSEIFFDNVDNMNVDYLNSIFNNESQLDAFADDLKAIKPIDFKIVGAEPIERVGMNVQYNKMIEDHCFKEKLEFNGSASMHSFLCRKNEFNICNQLKSVVLAQAAIKDPDSLDFPTSFSLIKSAVVAVGGFDKERLDDEMFPYPLYKGFFMSCSMNFIQDSNVQIFFIAIKTLIKSEEFMNYLGKKLVIMAQDRDYHSLLHKKDLVFIPTDELESFVPSKNDYIIDFPDGSKGKIEIDDSGSWINDTPMVFLLLLWIFIDNCTTPFQRTCAKLAIVDCMLIQSPMIQKYMSQFLTYLQRKIDFTPEDFNSVYIYQLSLLAQKNPKDSHIINFYNCEKTCFEFRPILQPLHSKTLDFNLIDKVDFKESKFEVSPTKMNELIQIMKTYKSVENFPTWYFIPIWKAISSIVYEKYSDDEACKIEGNHADISNNLDSQLLSTITLTVSGDDDDDVGVCIKVRDEGSDNLIELEKYRETYIGYYFINPSKSIQYEWKCSSKYDVKLQMYKVTENQQFSQDTLIADIKSFAVDWTNSDTDELLIECTSMYFNSDNFMWMSLASLDMTDLVSKFGIRVVQCKIACLYMLETYFDVIIGNYEGGSVSEIDKKEIKRLAIQNESLFSYQYRMRIFSLAYESDVLIEMVLSHLSGPIVLNLDSALRFINGESDDYCDSMIFQISEAIQKYPSSRFERKIWGIHFKGSDAVDVTGVTNQTITMAINSFLYLKTGLCVISPNFIDNTVDPSNMGETLVIPYATKDSKQIRIMQFAFGVVLGAMIRCGLNQDIPFPRFVWNSLAGDSITKDDIYENDTLLKDEIEKMKSGELKDHLWVYRDWDNVVKPILGFPEDKPVPIHLVDVYETLVIDLRIKALIRGLNIIRVGFWSNQDIDDPTLLSGGLIEFLCQGKKKLDIGEIIKRIIFKNENADENIKNNFITVLNEYDQTMIKKFLLFTTAKPKPPNFAVVPDYFIVVVFDDTMRVTGYPEGHTCNNTINVPIYPTLDIMREKLSFAFLNCEGMDAK